MAHYTRVALLAATACFSLAAPLGGEGAGTPTVSRETAVEWGATALNLTADLLVKTHAAPSGQTPRSDAAFLRKLGAEVFAEYRENPSKHVAESALVLGADALKLGAEVMAKTAPRAALDGEQSAPSRAIGHRASSPQDRLSADRLSAAGKRHEAAHAAPRGMPEATPQSLYGGSHSDGARAARRGSSGGGGNGGARAVAADKKIFDGVASGTFWRDAGLSGPGSSPGAGPVSLGRMESHAALRSMDDIPMGGGILGAAGAFGGHAAFTAMPEGGVAAFGGHAAFRRFRQPRHAAQLEEQSGSHRHSGAFPRLSAQRVQEDGEERFLTLDEAIQHGGPLRRGRASP